MSPFKLELDHKEEKPEMVQCIPDQYLSPTDEQKEQAKINLRKNVEARNGRIACRPALYKAYCEKRRSQGLSNDPIIGLNPIELLRNEGDVAWVAELCQSIEQRIYEKDVDLDALARGPNPEAECDPLVRKIASIVGSFVMLDKNMRIIAFKLEDGANELYRGTNNKRLEEILAWADDELEKVWPAQQPVKKDRRHPTNHPYSVAQRAYYLNRGLGHGRHHLGAWQELCQERNQTLKHGGPWCHNMTQDSMGGPGGTTKKEKARKAIRKEGADKFQERYAPLEIAMGAVYKAIDPEGFEKARYHRKFMADAGVGIKTYNEELQFGLVAARVLNKSVWPHKDEGDAHDTLACLMPYKEFDGAEFCLSEIGDYGHRFAALPGDLVIMAASLVEHRVTDFIGERGSLVILNKSDQSKLLQHRNFMTEAEREIFDVQHAEKMGKKAKEIEERRRAEVLRIERFLTPPQSLELFDLIDISDISFVDQSKIDNIPGYPNKLILAERSRNRTLKRISKLDDGPDEAILAELKTVPFSLFYPPNKQETHRISLGKNPFQILGNKRKTNEVEESMEMDHASGQGDEDELTANGALEDYGSEFDGSEAGEKEDEDCDME